MLKYIPDDINIEDVLSYLPRDAYRLSIDGLHKRNSYNDIISCEETSNGTLELHVGRNSLYNSLPEYMFHPINRFDNIPEGELAEEYTKQELEKENAHKFFSPIDVLLLDLRVKVKEKITSYASSNVVMQEVIGDTLTDSEKSNRFIKRVIPFLPHCKNIRGNRTLITLLLRKVLFEDGIVLQKESSQYEVVDVFPQYNTELKEDSLDSLYLGNVFCENVTKYSIQYWSNSECGEYFSAFLDEMEEFRLFIKDFFLSIEDELCFHITIDNPELRLSDDVYNYLNFNTNI